MATRRTLGLAAATLFVLAACTPAGSGGSPSAPAPGATSTTATQPTDAPASPTAAAVTPTDAPATATAAASEAPTSAPTTAPTSGASAAPTLPPPNPQCEGDALAAMLKNPGRLTLSTDIPAYPPWWGGDPATQYPHEPDDAPEWELSDPYSMEGYESATAYAIADVLGFAPEQVDWVPNAVFEQAFAPGDKAFDFHMAQISIQPDRAEAVDFSDPYFDANQSVIALTSNPITEVTSIQALKAFRLAAAANTTSFDLIDDVIQPAVPAQSPADNAVALQLLQNDQVDGLVVDLQTAFYMRDAQLENFDTPEPEATVVGQFSVSAQADQMGAVLELDSPLTECVNHAIATIKADGTLDAIYDEWISTGQEIPFFEE